MALSFQPACSSTADAKPALVDVMQQTWCYLVGKLRTFGIHHEFPIGELCRDGIAGMRARSAHVATTFVVQPHAPRLSAEEVEVEPTAIGEELGAGIHGRTTRV